MEALIFMGPIWYQRLRQMVEDKWHARSRGPRQVMTRQPTEGRSRDGGLRVGEMEKDCLGSMGCPVVMQDRFLAQSDDYILTICSNCGMIAEPARALTNKRKRGMIRAGKAYCRNCDRTEGVYKTRPPYNYKLLWQEAMGMGICMRFRPEKPRLDRDLETCASVGIYVKPEEEVIKCKRQEQMTSIQRDVTLMTGAYSSLVQEDFLEEVAPALPTENPLFAVGAYGDLD